VTEHSINYIEPISLHQIEPNRRKFVHRGLFMRFRRWLWNRWSEPTDSVKVLHHVREITDERVARLVTRAMNKQRLHPREVELIIVGPSQLHALQDDALEQQPPDFSMPMIYDAQLFIHTVRVRMIPWFDGILILTKERT
jgi:hypothetical protein